MVKLKRKVTIKKKAPVPEQPQEPVVPSTAPQTNSGDDSSGTSGTKGKGRWWWAVIIIVIAVIAFLIFRSCGTSAPATVEKERPAAVGDTLTSGDNTSTDSGQMTQEDDGGTPNPEETSPDETSSGDSMSSKNVVPEKTKRQDSHPAPSATVQVNDVEQTAVEVIRGVYGNGQVRKDKLGAAYTDVQRRVNEMYRQGLVK